MKKLDMKSSGQDDMVSLNRAWEYPRDVKGSDFKVGTVDDEASGQSGPHGTAKGQDELLVWSTTQEMPRHAEDNGPGEHGAGTPVPVDRGRIVKAHFPEKQSPERGTAVKWDCSVDLVTGQHDSDYKKNR